MGGSLCVLKQDLQRTEIILLLFHRITPHQHWSILLLSGENLARYILLIFHVYTRIKKLNYYV